MRGFLGLGSNVGDRRGHLEAAVAGLGARGVTVLASSSVYETEPVGLVLDQPAFLNACVEVSVEDDLAPLELLDRVKGLEAALGRESGGVRHGPRVIDIDILLLGSMVVSVEERLEVPHAGVAERRFVLVPLLELDPGLAMPDSGVALAELLAGLGEEAVLAVGPPLV